MKFPSPYGEVGFDLNNLFADVRKNNLYCFRPLTGKLVLIKAARDAIAKAEEVSVPLRGSWF